MYAAWNGHLDTVELLVKKGADFNVKTGFGKFSLKRTIQYN